ncbi:hypothetical protein [Demequina aurantiaca]|uniref:hypothetical protein n=1 Tax=Demequina aurantiaca TaxID=676200 RepID=UPI0007858B74|nr:hypothetical protein [Demequina aurantiaca]
MNPHHVAKAATCLLGAVGAVHVVALAGGIPFEYLGGGRYPDETTARIGELGALVTVSAFGWMTAARAQWLSRPSPRIVRGSMWAMGGLFALNTLGNLAATTLTETLIFTPITLALSAAGFYLAWRPADVRPTTEGH